MHYFDRFFTVEELAWWIKKNVSNTSIEKDNICYAPEMIFSDKKGNCLDIAYLIYKYCEYKNINCWFGQVGISYDGNSLGHIVCVMYLDKYYVVNCDILDEVVGFGSRWKNTALKKFASAYLKGMKEYVGKGMKFWRILPSEVSKDIDLMYKEKCCDKQKKFHELLLNYQIYSAMPGWLESACFICMNVEDIDKKRVIAKLEKNDYALRLKCVLGKFKMELLIDTGKNVWLNSKNEICNMRNFYFMWVGHFKYMKTKDDKAFFEKRVKKMLGRYFVKSDNAAMKEYLKRKILEG